MSFYKLAILMFSFVSSSQRDFFVDAQDETHEKETIVDIEDFPFKVSLQVSVGEKKYAHICGAALVGPMYVLTAASCQLNVTDNSVISSNRFFAVAELVNLTDAGKRKNVAEFYPHPHFNITPFANDIALVKLAGNFSLTIDLSPVRINQRKVSKLYMLDILTWNIHDSSKLNTVDANNNLIVVIGSLTDSVKCLKPNSLENVTEGEMCVHMHIDPERCVSGLGDPLVYDFTLVGVLSSPVFCSSGLRIASNITHYINWIMDGMGLARPAQVRSSAESVYCTVLVLVLFIYIVITNYSVS